MKVAEGCKKIEKIICPAEGKSLQNMEKFTSLNVFFCA